MSWIDDEAKTIEHGSGLRANELRRLFHREARGMLPPLGPPPPAFLTAGPRLWTCSKWARAENPQLRIEASHAR